MSSNISTNQKQILLKQQENMAKINLLIEQSHDALLCGPSCQREKTKSILENNYQNAQTTIKNAPYALEQAKKNYYTFTEGEGAYNSQLEEDLRKKADKISKLIIEKFKEEINRAKGLNTYLNSDLINSKNTLELYDDYMSKNKKKELSIQSTKSDLITNDRKTYYEAQEIDNLKYWYNILYILYYIIVIVFVITNLIQNNSITIFKKIFIIFLFIIYPYIIDYIAKFFIYIFNQFKSYLPKNVYKQI